MRLVAVLCFALMMAGCQSPRQITSSGPAASPNDYLTRGYEKQYASLAELKDPRIAKRFAELYRENRSGEIYSGASRITAASIVEIQVSAMTRSTTNTLLQKMGAEKFVLDCIASGYSQTWSDSIKNNEDVQGSISQLSDNYVYFDVINKSDSLYSLIRGALTGLSEQSFPHTFKLYSILSQFKELSTSPRGSLVNFNEEINNLVGQFEGESSLAELEWLGKSSR